jgi:hypothetical protein
LISAAALRLTACRLFDLLETPSPRMGHPRLSVKNCKNQTDPQRHHRPLPCAFSRNGYDEPKTREAAFSSKT